MDSATAVVAARLVSCSTASRTSVFSLNITVAPARTSRSAQKPTAGFAVTPENASLPPHCTPTTSSLAGTVSRRRASRRARCGFALATMWSIIDMKPTCASACRHTVSGPDTASRPSGIGKLPGGSSRSGCSFSQPRLTTITSPPKFGFSAMWRSVRMGISAPGASMATPQP